MSIVLVLCVCMLAAVGFVRVVQMTLRHVLAWFSCRARHADGTRCDLADDHAGPHVARCECGHAMTRIWSET